MTRRYRFALLFVLSLLAAAAHAQTARQFPGRSVRIIVPYAPGGATDLIARLVGARLAEAWGQPVIIDNRAGAAGNMALEAAAKANPDGHTLFVGNVSTNAINEITLASSLHVKPSRDLIGVTNLMEIPSLFVVNPAVPATTLRQFIEYAKSNGARLNSGSAGVGTFAHLDLVMFGRAAGIEMTHVPYKGGAGQMVTALVGNEVQAMFVNVASTLEFARTGRIRALAVTSPQRLSELPNVPTMAEAGFPGIGTSAWNGMLAPAGVPKPLLDKIFAATVAAMQRPDMQETLAKQMIVITLSKSPAEYTAFLRSETAKWARVVKDNNIRVE